MPKTPNNFVSVVHTENKAVKLAAWAGMNRIELFIKVLKNGRLVIEADDESEQGIAFGRSRSRKVVSIKLNKLKPLELSQKRFVAKD